MYTSSLTKAGMPMPVFTSRNVTTSIVIWDGKTVVMGGLIREEMTTIKDKIPILGDIPIAGLLARFRKNSMQKINLMIFITPRIVNRAEEVVRTGKAGGPAPFRGRPTAWC